MEIIQSRFIRIKYLDSRYDPIPHTSRSLRGFQYTYSFVIVGVTNVNFWKVRRDEKKIQEFTSHKICTCQERSNALIYVCYFSFLQFSEHKVIE